MQEIQFYIIVYISSMCFAQDISEQFNQITAHTSSSTQNDIENTKDSWQPMSQRNWILLNTEIKKDSTSAEAHTVAMLPNNNRNTIYSRLPHRFFTTSNTNAYTQAQLNVQKQQRHKEQQGHSHRLPLNYYTYNHSTDGNYISPTATDVKLIEPYIVTISKMRARTNMNTDAILTRRVSQSVVADPASTYSNVVKLGNFVSLQKEEKQDLKSNSRPYNDKTNRDGNNDATTTSALDGNNDKLESLFDKIEDVHLNEVFLPLRHTLDKVIYFCDIAKSLINNDNNDDDDDDEKEDANDNDLNTEDGATENRQAINTSHDVVQGHQNVSPKTAMLSLLKSSSTGQSRQTTSKETTTLTSIGTGRKIKKLKKKLSKFILPLLLAYKLKFLTLIPVFIGGLILLVGTTGLAGFFFALFTAVMSLKSTGSSKSIIVKKI